MLGRLPYILLLWNDSTTHGTTAAGQEQQCSSSFFYILISIKRKTSNLPAQPRKKSPMLLWCLFPILNMTNWGRPVPARPGMHVGTDCLNKLLIFPVLQDVPNPGCQLQIPAPLSKMLQHKSIFTLLCQTLIATEANTPSPCLKPRYSVRNKI